MGIIGPIAPSDGAPRRRVALLGRSGGGQEGGAAGQIDEDGRARLDLLWGWPEAQRAQRPVVGDQWIDAQEWRAKRLLAAHFLVLKGSPIEQKEETHPPDSDRCGMSGGRRACRLDGRGYREFVGQRR